MTVGCIVPGQRILIVGREKDLQRGLIRFLSHAGFHILTAPDGQHAAFNLALHRADLVILRLWPCDLESCETLEQIRRFSSVPVIGLVDPRDTEAAVAGLNGGADQVMAEPPNFQELQARIRALLRRSPPHRG
ncbi:MAG: DNA-binding response regulator [Chloroflexi bacterium]|nr:MAG: DNA-binding response regulator [Chloroflexota bacterium]